MSLALLFQQTKPRLDAIEIDASLSETHKHDGDKTSHSIESGAKFTDHIHLDDPKVTIFGVVSEQPDVLGASFNAALGGAGRHKGAWQALLALRQRRQPFTVFTSLATYPNMVIRSLQTTRNARNTNTLEFTAELEQISISSVTLVQNLAAETADLAQAEADLGGQGTGPV